MDNDRGHAAVAAYHQVHYLQTVNSKMVLPSVSAGVRVVGLLSSLAFFEAEAMLATGQKRVYSRIIQ